MYFSTEQFPHQWVHLRATKACPTLTRWGLSTGGDYPRVGSFANGSQSFCNPTRECFQWSVRCLAVIYHGQPVYFPNVFGHVELVKCRVSEIICLLATQHFLSSSNDVQCPWAFTIWNKYSAVHNLNGHCLRPDIDVSAILKVNCPFIQIMIITNQQ